MTFVEHTGVNEGGNERKKLTWRLDSLRANGINILANL